MTASEMKNEFLILYDKITNFEAPGYTDEEISVLLTKGQERLFFSYYNPLSNQFKEGYEETEARRKDLNELTKNATPVPSANQTGTLPNGTFFDLPSDFLFAISEEITVNSEDSCINGKRIQVKPVTHDEYSINVKNPFKRPYDQLAWRMDFSRAIVNMDPKRHEIITDSSYSVGQYHLRYIKTLTPIIIGNNTVDGVSGPKNCELNSITHKRIIDEAVKIATGTTDPQMYQIKTIENQASE